ncbi:prepilin-type N-terminal cleavage/methylation domain-containing protein [Paenibacillus sp. UNCCL117]|uniref:competence type IV pilus major pilin ComGC n=1 Tax=unclassified Paenibacillus TaxID=185978 RepID=UPI000883A027|nr:MULTISPECIES: prepilin-type N-terminal cleavage/methylation domain-containing protein [unclassified Paenibacillus]SDC46772.1 prepilin-type N-terminal cleavage/methylation domain-containing protein [Paenibacillus sp. cl123]SFW12244.1 prepilin-type N-terminal cleavage/methylation domain-containing protein [Paenibacillus sp. UNCCL117]
MKKFLKLKLFRKNEKGLTLVELLAVIVILGVIAAIAVPSIGGVIQNSKVNADTQSEELIRDAAVRYLIDRNIATTVTNVTIADLQTNGYLKAGNINRQATGVPYVSVTVAHNANTGWTATTVNTGTATPTNP